MAFGKSKASGVASVTAERERVRRVIRAAEGAEAALNAAAFSLTALDDTLTDFQTDK